MKVHLSGPPVGSLAGGLFSFPRVTYARAGCWIATQQTALHQPTVELWQEIHTCAVSSVCGKKFTPHARAPATHTGGKRKPKAGASPPDNFPHTGVASRNNVLQSSMIAALYVDPSGPYPKMLDVDCWDEARDAKLYAGPYPVVAHPPCGPWSRLRHLCTRQDPSCGPAAVCATQRWGGVLEHPAHSRLFEYMGLPKPGDATDGFSGRTFEVRQVDWGHVCEKPTWLYVVRSDQTYLQRKLREQAGTGIATRCVSRDAKRQSSRLKRASGPQCRLTPLPFAELLVEVARRAR